MTIFGFNTDVKHGDTVYHVQSESRDADLLLQTLVFIKGQCVEKHVSSYAHMFARPDFSQEVIHEYLKSQHKNVLETIQAGQRGVAPTASSEVQDIGGGLAITMIEIQREAENTRIRLRFQVTDAGQAASKAAVKCWPCGVTNPLTLAQTTSGIDGIAELQIPVTEDVQRESAVMLQATCLGKSATRKFRFRK
jgi:hypothetical protein